MSPSMLRCVPSMAAAARTVGPPEAASLRAAGRHRAAIFLLGICVFAAYNLNGREIPSYDSQPTKFTATALALRGTLVLDETIAASPGLAERPAFGYALDGHWRSRYPIAPAIPAAMVATILSRLGTIDLRRTASSNIVAKLTASLLVTVAVMCAYLVARRFTTHGIAITVAIGFGLGTGLWPTASQTLWQHETVIVCLTGALAVLSSETGVGTGRAVVAAALLGAALAARLQVLLLALVLGTLLLRGRTARQAWVVLPFFGIPLVQIIANIKWFGHPLGGAIVFEALHATVHGTSSSFSARPWEGLLGLIVSPSRGLLIYSPVIVVAFLGLPIAWRVRTWSLPLACATGAALQIAAYSAYSVWWAGHTFGPRYLLDILPATVPLAAIGANVASQRRWTAIAATALLAWSMIISATGAFCYPADRWNTSPVEVDTHHERLWQWRDPQFLRCWRTGLSPQNFDFFHRDDRRETPPAS